MSQEDNYSDELILSASIKTQLVHGGGGVGGGGERWNDFLDQQLEAGTPVCLLQNDRGVTTLRPAPAASFCSVSAATKPDDDDNNKTATEVAGPTQSSSQDVEESFDSEGQSGPRAVAVPGIGSSSMPDDGGSFSSIVFEEASVAVGDDDDDDDSREANSNSRTTEPSIDPEFAGDAETAPCAVTKEEARGAPWLSRRKPWLIVLATLVVVAVVVVGTAVSVRLVAQRSADDHHSEQPSAVPAVTRVPTPAPIVLPAPPPPPVMSPITDDDDDQTIRDINLTDRLSVYVVQWGHFFDCQAWDTPLAIEFQCHRSDEEQISEVLGYQSSSTSGIVSCANASQQPRKGQTCQIEATSSSSPLAASGETLFLVGCGSNEDDDDDDANNNNPVVLTARVVSLVGRQCTTGVSTGLSIGAACFTEGTNGGEPVWEVQSEEGRCGPSTTAQFSLPTSTASEAVVNVCGANSFCVTRPCSAVLTDVDASNESNCFLSQNNDQGGGVFDWDVASVWETVHQTFFVQDYARKSHLHSVAP